MGLVYTGTDYRRTGSSFSPSGNGFRSNCNGLACIIGPPGLGSTNGMADAELRYEVLLRVISKRLMQPVVLCQDGKGER